MKRKRNVLYQVTNFTGYWYFPSLHRWVSSEDADSIKLNHSTHSGFFRTVVRARQNCINLPGGIMLKYTWKKGNSRIEEFYNRKQT